MDAFSGRIERGNVAPRARGRPRADEVAAIDRQLLDAALREFLRWGYGAASMRGIARAANVSRTTLTARFASKADLFSALMTAQAVRMSAGTALQPDGTPDLARGLIAYVSRSIEYSLEPDVRELKRLILSTAEQFPEVATPVLAGVLVSRAELAAFIRRCAEADGIPCRRPEIVADAIMLMLGGWFQRTLMGEDIAPAAERRRWVEDMVAALIAGRAGW